jgi:hypothetical protein
VREGQLEAEGYYQVALPPGLHGDSGHCGPYDGWRRQAQVELQPSGMWSAVHVDSLYENTSGALPPSCALGSALGIRSLRLRDTLDGSYQFDLVVDDQALPGIPEFPVVFWKFNLWVGPPSSSGQCVESVFDADALGLSAIPQTKRPLLPYCRAKSKNGLIFEVDCLGPER